MNDVNQIRPSDALNEDFSGTTFCIKQEPLDIEPDYLPDADCESDPESRNEAVCLEVMAIEQIDRNLLKSVKTRKRHTLNSKNIEDINREAQTPIRKRRKIMKGPQKLDGIDVDERNGNTLQSVKIQNRRSTRSQKINVITLEDIDKKVLRPIKKRTKIMKSDGLKTAESVERGLKCSEKYCDFYCDSADALDSHINLRHGASRKEDRRRKSQKNKGVASAESESSQDDTEEECGQKQEFVDASGFVVRLENTYSNGRLMFTCSRCKNTFRKKEAARAHIVKVHMNIRRFTCIDCGKGFERSLDLEEHIKVHTGERPFKCPAVNCVYSASWTGSLYRHVRRRHKDYQGELTLAVVAKKDTSKQVLAVDHKFSELKSENPSSPTIPTGSEKMDNILDMCRKAEQTELPANISSLGKNHDSETIAHQIEGRAAAIEIKTEMAALSIVQAPPVEDVENDSGQLDVFEEANIIDNRNEKDPHYTCKICSGNFEHLYTIKRHVNVAHKYVRRRTCMICGITLARRCNINIHIRSHTGERPHKCAECGKGFITTSDLRRHARRFQHPSGLQKKIVPFVENDSQMLDLFEEANIIYNGNDREPQYTCKICSNYFANIDSIRCHVNEAHIDVKKRTCLICGITLAHSSSYETHIKIHTGERPHKCGDCGKDFISKYMLRRHARVVHNAARLRKKEVINECIICKTVFENASELEKHASIHVPRGTDLMKGFGLTPYENAKITNNESLGTTVYTCNICNIQFSVLSVAKDHVNKVHKDVKTLSCLYCGSTASSLFILKKHIAVHDGSSTFKCFNSRCSYVSGQYANFQHHLRDCASISSRTAVRKCTICNAEFGELGILQSHFRTTHKVAISYSCLHCEYSFAALSDLTEHVKSHDDIQPMVRCPIEDCQFTVTSEEDRMKHHQWHEKKSNPLPRPFVCESCGKDFSTKVCLLRHMRRVHSQKCRNAMC